MNGCDFSFTSWELVGGIKQQIFSRINDLSQKPAVRIALTEMYVLNA